MKIIGRATVLAAAAGAAVLGGAGEAGAQPVYHGSPMESVGCAAGATTAALTDATKAAQDCVRFANTLSAPTTEVRTGTCTTGRSVKRISSIGGLVTLRTPGGAAECTDAAAGEEWAGF